MVDKSATTLSLTIAGLTNDGIEAVKQEIKKCCERESADIYISGSMYSDIIKNLDQLQVFKFTTIWIQWYHKCEQFINDPNTRNVFMVSNCHL